MCVWLWVGGCCCVSYRVVVVESLVVLVLEVVVVVIDWLTRSHCAYVCKGTRVAVHATVAGRGWLLQLQLQHTLAREGLGSADQSKIPFETRNTEALADLCSDLLSKNRSMLLLSAGEGGGEIVASVWNLFFSFGVAVVLELSWCPLAVAFTVYYTVSD